MSGQWRAGGAGVQEWLHLSCSASFPDPALRAYYSHRGVCGCASCCILGSSTIRALILRCIVWHHRSLDNLHVAVPRLRTDVLLCNLGCTVQRAWLLSFCPRCLVRGLQLSMYCVRTFAVRRDTQPALRVRCLWHCKYSCWRTRALRDPRARVCVARARRAQYHLSVLIVNLWHAGSLSPTLSRMRLGRDSGHVPVISVRWSGCSSLRVLAFACRCCPHLPRAVSWGSQRRCLHTLHRRWRAPMYSHLPVWWRSGSRHALGPMSSAGAFVFRT